MFLRRAATGQHVLVEIISHAKIKERYLDVKWEPLVVHNTGLGVLRGHLTGEGKLLVENTPQSKLVSFMPGGSRQLAEVLKNPDNALIVAGPSTFVGEWLYEGRDNENADAFTPPFSFSSGNQDDGLNPLCLCCR